MNHDQIAIFINHIQEQASRYFPGLTSEQVSVQFLEKQERPTARLYRFEVKDQGQKYSIFVKVPLYNQTRIDTHKSRYEKPVLFQRVGSKDRHKFEYTALVDIQNYFSQPDNKHLGAIRVLDYLPEYSAIFTEGLNDPKLQDLFLKASRLNSFTDHDITDAFRNAGIWLHVYHRMPKNEDVQIRHQYRDEFFEAITKLTQYLSKSWGDTEFFGELTSTLISQGRKSLPETLPLALGHGDFAMRNILVGRNSRVTVFDTFASFQTPIYEDIGYFLNGLKITYQQVFSQGFLISDKSVRTYEREFLSGYFGSGTIPYPAIRFYEILALLDKWSSVVMHYRHRSAKLKSFGKVKAVLASRYFKKNTILLVRRISEVESGSKSWTVERSF